MIPNKLTTGANFKADAKRKINEIIDYLKTQRLVSDGKTIVISQCAGGVVIRALPQTVTPKTSKKSTNIELGILTTTPNGAIGEAAYKATKFDINGGHEEQSNSKPTIVPYMGGYYV